MFLMPTVKGRRPTNIARGDMVWFPHERWFRFVLASVRLDDEVLIHFEDDRHLTFTISEILLVAACRAEADAYNDHRIWREATS